MSLPLRTDVTAVKLYRSYILAGIGSHISVFEKLTAKRLQRILVLRGQKVYGFEVSKCGNKIIVFGGKQFTVLKVEGAEASIFYRCFEPVLCDDWLHSSAWINQDSIALLTAHNVVQKWTTSGLKLLSIHKSTTNSILYSGLLLPVQDDLIILAGTVFSEIVIHQCGEDTALHNLEGHRGVIFSIQCDPKRNIIVTTSDDRSVRIWFMNNLENIPCDTIEFWKKNKIECMHEVYGHTARVMKSLITDNFIVSCGEDGAICYWDLEGRFIRKISTHQSATVWSIDGDNNHVVTGGGDGGIVLHPLTAATEYFKKESLNFDDTPKHMAFTARNNIISINDGNQLIYYDVKSNLSTVLKLFDNTNSYKMLSLTPCRQIIAVADIKGNLNIYIENCKDASYLQCIVETQLPIDKLMSTHWAGNRHLVTCNSDGQITVLAAKNTEIELYAKFSLPNCKEKYLTAAAINPKNNMIICGDRNGNVHCFVKGSEAPIKTFKKAHGKYGPTSISYKDNLIVTTGREGTVKYHFLEEDNIYDSKYLTERHFDFQWVEKFLDKDENLLCGFRAKTFVVFNIKLNAVILEVPCGGGHRAWDAVRYFEKVDGHFEEVVQLVYVKASIVYSITTQLSKIVSKTIVNGSHSKNINCLKTFKSDLDSSLTFYISGGEDTTMRISSTNSDSEFQDEFVFKHISNVRTVKLFPIKDNQILVLSAGGRAQICVNIVTFVKQHGKTKVLCQEIVDYMLMSECDERKLLKVYPDRDYLYNPETRIMELDVIKCTKTKFIVFVGCSDMYLRTFVLDISSKDKPLKPLQEIEYHKTCILKTICIKFDNRDIVITSTTRGQIAFWNVITDIEEIKVVPFDNTLSTNNAGTNSMDYKVVDDKLVIIVGGDNNAIDLYLLTIDASDLEGKLSMKTIDHKRVDSLHCAGVTGLALVDDIMISTSIDQRVTICRLHLRNDGIGWTFLKQIYSDIADIHGLDVLEHSSESVTVCVYGKGFEVLKIGLIDAD